MINSAVQSQLAKLLAKENIEIRHGEYHTAFFDVEKRVLGLPMWKDKGKDVYDLLVGHEVGHALNTPADGWHESTIELQVPRSYVNVIEDIRIEKKVQRTYPGLVASFQRGYTQLFEEDFFGTADRDLNDYSLIDRINILAKLGQRTGVEFSDEERPLVKKAMAVETWEDVLEVCSLLMEYAKENEQEETQEDEITNSTSAQAPEGLGETEEQESSEDVSEDTREDSRGEEIDSWDSPSDMDPEEQSAQERMDQQYQSETDEAFRNKEKELLEDLNGQPRTFSDFDKKQVEEMVIDHEMANMIRNEYQESIDRDCAWRAPEWESEYDEFMKETKSIVTIMAKEFEMRKAAFQYARAQEAKTGAINPIKLYSYKYNDDIFNRVLNLADAKSHGLVMYVDFSGSMLDTIFQVIQQTICLTQFCKKVNIPFEVYSFTTGRDGRGVGVDVGQIDHTPVKIVELISSKMKKAEYLKTIKSLYQIGRVGIFWGVDSMGATPLNETIMAAHKMIPAFQKKTGVQKVTAVFLTDGEPSNMYFGNRNNDKMIDNRYGFGFQVMIGKKKIQASSRVQLSTDLLKNLGESTGCTVTGFFIATSPREFNSYTWRRGIRDNQQKELRSKWSREKSVKVADFGGYDELYILKSGNALSATNDEFEVSEDAKKGELTRAFKKFANSKKNNRIIMSSFAKKIA